MPFSEGGPKVQRRKAMNCRASYCFHAHRIHGNGPCERCGRDARDVHHRDGDWRNNAPQNLERLCRSCHVTEHNRRRQAVTA